MPDFVRRTVFLLASLVLGVALTAQQSPQPPATPAPQPPPAGTAPQGPPPGGAGPGGRQGGRGFGGGTPIRRARSARRARPRSVRATAWPRIPPPSIVDYRPKSTLVTPAHMVPKAKYPAIDYPRPPQGLLEHARGPRAASARRSTA